MRKSFYATLLVLAMVAVYAVAQSTNAPSSQSPDQDRNSNRPVWSEKPSTGQGKYGKSDRGATAADRDTLQRQVQQQLQSDPALGNVTVEVSDKDVVTLSGTVAGKNDREHAKQLAESVPGVRKVKDKIKIGGAPAASSGSAAATSPSIQNVPSNTAGSIAGNTQAQAGSSAPSSSASAAGAMGGVSGAASSSAQSESAQSSAATSGSVGASTQPSGGTPGQSTTTEQGAPMGATTAAQSAIDLRAQIENSLQKEQLTGVIVNVGDDKVELTGTVQNGKEKQTAQRIAQSYAGNRKVVDHIKVLGQGASAGPDKTSPYPNAPGAPNNPGNPNNPNNPSPQTLPPGR